MTVIEKRFVPTLVMHCVLCSAGEESPAERETRLLRKVRSQ